MRFRTIVADPPWAERGSGRVKRGADRHYPVIASLDDMVGVIEGYLFGQVADDAHLYLWATANHLEMALEVARRVGFEYKTNLVWVKRRSGKLQTGLGQYFRGSHELCLFCTRGKGYAVRSEARNIKSVLEAPRGRHSAKPADFYALVQARSRGPYLELFARAQRPGWTCWGNEV